MDKMASCRNCGRIIQNSYSYCPYCGVERVSADIVIHEVASRLKQVEDQAIAFRLDKCDEKLDTIARELDDLIARIAKK